MPPEADERDYDHASQFTAASLQKLIETTEQLTHLSLPDRTALVDEIARIIPAGNVPSLVAAGLAHLPGRAVPIAESRRNLSLLMQGMQTFLDKAVYNTFFVGPATVLSGYQMLLKLAGKDLDASFPEGTWQFYVEFGLREDSGRHTCETVGFQSTLESAHLRLSPADELVAWVAASAWLLDRYHVLLANEWTEHTRLRDLQALLPEKTISRRWLTKRPYGTPADSNLDFTDHQRKVFDAFCEEVLANANPRLRKRAEENWAAQESVYADARAAYLRQMTMLAALQPAEHSDTRIPLSRSRVSIAVISGGRYYLVDIGGVVSVENLCPMCAAILKDKPTSPPATLDKALAAARRHDQPGLRRLLPAETLADLDRLRSTPIVVNWDLSQSDDLLADIRGGRRGVGDHALTIFRASRSMVFDQSHIFFDGPWGMAVAEILTEQASRYAKQLSSAPRFETLPEARCLSLEAPSGFSAASRKSQIPPEVSGESDRVNVALMEQVRSNLHKRNIDLRLTVNDLLLLHRALFNQIYQPSGDLMRTLAELASSSDSRSSQAGMMAQTALEDLRRTNPALLIPMDANSVSPRERIYPTTFRNPFTNLPDQHRKALTALENMESAGMFGKLLASRAFEETRRDYFSTLHAFGQVVARYKDVSMKGESVSTATIRLLAGLPASVQRMLDSVPGTFDVLNDMIKGQEVFSNVGRVAASSSLTRFNTAKDDNEKKVLAWGIMTDAKGVMRVSLRDARPHVAALVNAKQQAVARQMAQEFVDAYAITLNTYLEALNRIARARWQAE